MICSELIWRHQMVPSDLAVSGLFAQIVHNFAGLAFTAFAEFSVSVDIRRAAGPTQPCQFRTDIFNQLPFWLEGQIEKPRGPVRVAIGFDRF